MKTRRSALAACLAACLWGGATPALADLDAYVKAADPAFAWKHVNKRVSDAGTMYLFRLTSQDWQGAPWEHNLQVYEPVEIKYPDAALLFITGGNKDSQVGPKEVQTGFTLANACGARCVVLPQVPNQPLMGGKSEDDLIAETFTKYLDTQDETLPLLFPMVKSAVRAMDAAQQWAEKEGKPIKRFVVSGASKRGWTTWLTAAVDKRVAAIAPMVIPTLNMKAQSKHQIEVWGKHSEQIADYTRRGLTEKFDTPDGAKLWAMIDPYTYRERYTMPKLLINGTNDRYWTLDSLNLFWDDLPDPKWVVYLPNAGHGLDQHRDYAINGVGALFRHVVSGRAMPTPKWKFEEADGGAIRLEVEPTADSRGVKFWVATADGRDFREVSWEVKGEARPGAERAEFQTAPRGDGSIALFADIAYEFDGLEYHLSTQIHQVLKPAR